MGRFFRDRLRAAFLILGVLVAWGCAARPLGMSEFPQQKNAWFLGGQEQLSSVERERNRTGRARNIILFVGDGLDVVTVTAARIRQGQLRGETGEENLLSFEHLPHRALLKTYNTNQQVPDSAGAGTALIAGVKTKAGVVH